MNINDVLDQVVVLMIFNTTGGDTEAEQAMDRLVACIEAATIAIVPRVFGVAEPQESLFCATGLRVEDGLVLVSACNVTQAIGFELHYDTKSKTATAVAQTLIDLMNSGQIGYGFTVIDQDYPFDPNEDLPEELFFDDNGIQRRIYTEEFNILYVDGSFQLPSEEEDEVAEEPIDSSDNSDYC